MGYGMSYDDWKTGYYEDMGYDQPRIKSNEEEELEKIVEGCSYFFEGIIKELYKNPNEIDLEILRHCVDEMAWMLKLKVDPDKIMIRPKDPNINLDRWIEQNNNYLRNMNQNMNILGEINER